MDDCKSQAFQLREVIKRCQQKHVKAFGKDGPYEKVKKRGGDFMQKTSL